MNRWSHLGRYTPAPKKPPPEHGIRMKKAGTTWWGQHWIEALENVLRGDANRLARGRSYARAGRTHDLVIETGKVSARVTGSRAVPYQIGIQLRRLDGAAWKKAIAAMAEKAQFSAELLAGQMPRDIDDVFHAAGASLFPEERADLVTSCTCPDWGDPCKHVAATHYVLGEALDRDPFLLFELRGKTKEQVLDALRAARGAAHSKKKQQTLPRTANKNPARPAVTPKSASIKPASTNTTESATTPEQIEVSTVTLRKLKPADYDRPREPLPSFHASFAEPGVHGAVLRQLGEPSIWEGDASPADVLAPLVHAAAQVARRLALADPLDPSAADARAPKTRKRKTSWGRKAAGKKPAARRAR
jgi:uncharacterized Zn finger protein